MSFTCPRCGAVSHHQYHNYCGRCHDFTGEPVDQREQSWFELRQAIDQMAVARWREEHPNSTLDIPDHGELIFWLLDQLALQHRLDRVDTALAKQLGEFIALNSRLKTVLLALYQWYDRDGSVGAASEVFETNRAAIK